MEYGYYVQGDASGPPSFSQGGPRSDFGFGFDAQERVITGYGMRITPIYNSSWSTGLNAPLEAAQQTEQQYEPLPSVPILREKLLERLDDTENKGRCRKFLEAVLKNLGINKTVENLYDEVAKNGGFIAASDVLQKYGAQAISSYGKKSPYPVGIQALLKGDDKYTSNQRVQSYISSIIHELIHRAGISRHEGFGNAAFNALSAEDKKANPLPEKKTDSTYEDYFTKRFNENCRYDPYAVK